jgi:diguanylate cyclase (GGDEF)-like protein
MTSPETLTVATRERGNGAGGPVRERVTGPAEHPLGASRMRRLFRTVWSSSDFDGADLTRFAQPVMRIEAQQGLLVLGTLTMLLMAGLALLYYALHLGTAYVYTFALLAALAGHTAMSAKLVSDIKVLYLLGMVLLAGCGLAFMLLAHRYGVFTATLFSTVVLLFMVVPLVPWGLREALIATGIVYFIFTASTLSAVRAFTAETMWTLQFLMLTGATIALTVVARAVLIRKAHVAARFRLTAVNDELYGLSRRDSLTGAWNRRFLQEQFGDIVAQHVALGQGSSFGLIDIDKFKQLNDTYGHLCGDRVLQRLVRVLTDALRSDDYVVRMGGDEFAILLRGGQERARVECALSGFIRLDDGCPGLPELPRVSVGLVYLPAGVPASLEESYLKADKALYAAKEHPSCSIVEADSCRQNSA